MRHLKSLKRRASSVAARNFFMNGGSFIGTGLKSPALRNRHFCVPENECALWLYPKCAAIITSLTTESMPRSHPYLLARTCSDTAKTTPSGSSVLGAPTIISTGRLHDYEGQYQQFQFTYCTNVQIAFIAECELWYAYADKQKQIHPARPAGTRYACPVSGCTMLI